jgi:hypothetical protein
MPLPRHDWILTVAQARMADVSDERATLHRAQGNKATLREVVR